MDKFKNILWIIALIIILVLIGVLVFGYYRNGN